MFFKKKLVKLEIPKVGILIDKDDKNECYSYTNFFKNYIF